ncbi:membrane lipoprotein lipid attachment site-containing protein [Bacillus cereus]|uniref:membrane lipoprotein lipid attachment site-containing protein n=1 Tax=Bacillus cereus TaxID=1396 RepID=UPI000BF755A0|nr:membrane lipoprotein lipid attachment site-containing protein [Bacillus cereus]MDZ4594100.1 membrane lipoprotein lipid attachment site-containing protein [Bacillus cereus]PEU88037.1 hypothetical protein CN415_24535 [Bacillus cereus]
MKKFIFTFFLVFIVLSGCSKNEFTQKQDQAIELLKKGDYMGSHKILDTLSKDSPDDSVHEDAVSTEMFGNAILLYERNKESKPDERKEAEEEAIKQVNIAVARAKHSEIKKILEEKSKEFKKQISNNQ